MGPVLSVALTKPVEVESVAVGESEGKTRVVDRRSVGTVIGPGDPVGVGRPGDSVGKTRVVDSRSMGTVTGTGGSVGVGRPGDSVGDTPGLASSGAAGAFSKASLRGGEGRYVASAFKYIVELRKRLMHVNHGSCHC